MVVGEEDRDKDMLVVEASPSSSSSVVERPSSVAEASSSLWAVVEYSVLEASSSVVVGKGPVGKKDKKDPVVVDKDKKESAGKKVEADEWKV